MKKFMTKEGKRILAFLCAGLMVASLAGCGKKILHRRNFTMYRRIRTLKLMPNIFRRSSRMEINS